MDVDTRATAAGFAAAAVVLGALVWFVGVDRLLDVLSTVDTAVVPAIVVVAIVWVAAWGLALRAVLATLDVSVSAPFSIVLYAGALFANNVTPLGQAGGEPITALLVTVRTGADYETALAAIASADAINFLPSTAFALVGVAYFSTVAIGREIRVASAVVVGFAILLPVVGYLAWRGRTRIERAAVGLLTPIARTVGRRLPRVTAPTRMAIAARVDGFVRSLEVVADDRRAVAIAVGLSALGWFAQMVSLWLALYALGVTAPAAAVFVSVPVGAFAGVTILPGGLGGIEAVLVAMLVPTAGVTAVTALAAVILHRIATYWLPMLIGGGVVAAIGTDAVDRRRAE